MKTALQFLSLAFLVFAFAPVSPAGEGYFPPMAMLTAEKPLLEQLTDTLSSMKEPPLWPLAGKGNKAAFRFIHYAAKGGGTSIFRLDQDKRGWVLTFKDSRFVPDKKGGTRENRIVKKRRVSKEQIGQFRDLFDTLQFWNLPTLPPVETIMNPDGSGWNLEAVRNGMYNIVFRVSPKDDIWVERKLFEADLEDKSILETHPTIDRETYSQTNRRLVAVCEFLANLAGVEVRDRR